MSKKPGVIINLKPTPSGYMVIDIETQLLNRTPKIVPPVLVRQPQFKRPQRPQRPQRTPEEEPVPREIPRMLPIIVSEPMPITEVVKKIPVSSLWFSQSSIHPIEIRALPEFFGQNLSEGMFDKGPELYKFIRNTIVKMWKDSGKIVSTSMCRKTIPGNSIAIMRVHKLLENWGIINFPCKDQRGIKINPQQRIDCHVCSNSSPISYVTYKAPPFTLCQVCYDNSCFPASFNKEEFKKICLSDYSERIEEWSMQENAKLLELISKDRENVNWTTISKELGRPKEKVLLHFLHLPLQKISNISIFENGEDTFSIEQPREYPTVFQDINNPIQLGALILAKQALEDKDPKAIKSLQGAQRHGQNLVIRSEEMIRVKSNMVIEGWIGKLGQKTSYLAQCEKVIMQQRRHVRRMATNSILNLMRKSIK